MTLPDIAIRTVQKKIITCQCIGKIIGAVSVIGNNHNQDVHDHDDHYKGILLVVIMA